MFRRGTISRHLNAIVSWGVFFILLLSYWFTTPPTVSYWDCPEYVTAAWRLEIGHPPGNPLWMLVERIVTMLAPSGKYAALAINLSSGLFMAFAGFFLAQCLYLGIEWICRRNNGKSAWIAGVASASGALAFGWCDSAWYSAVEAEVYALSIFLTALCVWLMIKWGLCRDNGKSSRYIILIFYLTGLSIGVHQLNLLCIPAMSLIWGYKRGVRGWRRITLLLLASLALVGLILMGMMPGLIKLAGFFELQAVNNWHLPFSSGVIIFFIVCTIVLLSGIIITYKYAPGIPYTASWCVTMLLVGYSVYLIIPIRGGIGFPANSTRPGNPFTFASYLGREQYGGAPLIYGPTPLSSPLLREEWKDGKPSYTRRVIKGNHPILIPKRDGMRIADNYHLLTPKDSNFNSKALSDKEDAYVIGGYNADFEYTPELNMWFPRITSRKPSDFPCFEDWAGMKIENMQKVRISEALDTLKNPVNRINTDGIRGEAFSYRPTYTQSVRMLFTYQLGFMYFRYLLWNFSGRQNDHHSTGEVEHGNFITGLPFIDNAMLGAESYLPRNLGADNKGRNRYFMLPLILGLIGIFWLGYNRNKHVDRSRSRFINLTIATLFIMTGVAIVIYLNQSPGEPRERDYSFLGSYWAFAAWIGFGSAALMFRFRRYAAIMAMLPLGIAVWMFTENLDDHNRTNRYAASRIASNILRSLPQDAIIFVNGDNGTFPLWYAQEVEGIRKDVKIINLAYLSVPSYVDALMCDWDGAKAIPTTLSRNTVAYGAMQFPTISAGNDSVVPDALDILREMEKTGTARINAGTVFIRGLNGDTIHFNTRNLSRNGGRNVDFRRLMIFDIIATNFASSNPRPIHWASTQNSNAYAGFRPYTSRALYTRQLGNFSVEQREKQYMENLNMIEPPNCLENPPYLDPTPAGQVSIHRAAMTMAGKDLLDNGKITSALKMLWSADSINGNDPETYNAISEYDTVFNTRAELPLLFNRLADSLQIHDKIKYRREMIRLRKRAAELNEINKKRNNEFTIYKKTLSPDLRLKLSR